MHNKENCSPSSNGGFGANTNSATAQMQSNGGVFASLYSTLFNEDNPSPSSGTCNNNGGSHYPYEGLKYAATESGIRQSQYSHDSMVIQKHQDMVNRHSICLSRLVETSREIETLRQENSQLRAINRELQKQLSLFFHASIEDRFGGSSGHNTTPFDLAQGFRGVHIGDDSCRDGKENNCSDWNNNNNNKNKEQDQDQVSEESPSSVIENNNGGGVEVERFSLPKSISVRSNGYLKMGQSAGTGAGTGTGNRNTKGDTRPRTPLTTPPEVVQKVYVRGGKKEEEPLEMVVYNQGMFKTELCNKWQETGACPYGYHCQFAHGIGELRPVIRHPRYKTEVCRMVLAGVACPYGHRCHFRHALTEEEKAIAQQKLRTLKLER